MQAGLLIGRCEEKTGIVPFEQLIGDDVMAREPYASARTVYVVCDNGSSHRGHAAIARTKRAKWENVTLVHVPVHASWLNQIEIVFSILQRKVLTPNDLTDTDEVAERIAIFRRARFNEQGPSVQLALHEVRPRPVLEEARGQEHELTGRVAA